MESTSKREDKLLTAARSLIQSQSRAIVQGTATPVHVYSALIPGKRRQHYIALTITVMAFERLEPHIVGVSASYQPEWKDVSRTVFHCLAYYENRVYHRVVSNSRVATHEEAAVSVTFELLLRGKFRETTGAKL